MNFIVHTVFFFFTPFSKFEEVDTIHTSSTDKVKSTEPSEMPSCSSVVKAGQLVYL